MRKDLFKAIKQTYPKLMTNVIDIEIQDVSFEENPDKPYRAVFINEVGKGLLYFKDAEDFKARCAEVETKT